MEGGGGYMGRSFHRGIFHGGREVLHEGAPDFPSLFKKRSEIK